jgi:hypothetical protein
MVHKSSLIPGISKFIDEGILSHYPPTSMKRILMAGGVSLYLKQNEGIVETLISNPLVSGLGIVKPDGMVDIDTLRDTLKKEINKVGFMRISLPIIGDIDFTTDDIDMLHKFITESHIAATTPQLTIPHISNGGVY